MSQLSLFSADLTPPQLSDLGGLLAAHGQIAAGPDGFRLSIMLADQWRAEALLRECRVRDVTAEVLAGPTNARRRRRSPGPATGIGRSGAAQDLHRPPTSTIRCRTRRTDGPIAPTGVHCRTVAARSTADISGTRRHRGRADDGLPVAANVGAGRLSRRAGHRERSRRSRSA